MLPELREKIEAAARESGRSMNAEIVARLEESFSGGVDSKVATVLSQKLAEAEFLVVMEKVKYVPTLIAACAASEMAIELARLIKEEAPSVKLNPAPLDDMTSIYNKTKASLDALGPDPWGKVANEASFVQEAYDRQTNKLLALMRHELDLNKHAKDVAVGGENPLILSPEGRKKRGA